MLSETLTDISGIRIVAEPGARFRGNVDMESVNVDCPSDLDIKIDSAGVVYPYKIPRGFKRPFAEKGLWLGAGDLVRDIYTRVDPGTLIKEKIDWSSDDTWETDSLPIAFDEAISWALAASSVWHVALRPAIVGAS